MRYLELAKKVVKETLKAHGNQDLGKAKDVTIQATLQPISQETLHGIFEEALQDLGRREDAGILYFGEKDPMLQGEERKSLSRVDDIWKGCLEAKATLEAFKDTVRDWQDAILKLYSPPSERINTDKKK